MSFSRKNHLIAAGTLVLVAIGLALAHTWFRAVFCVAPQHPAYTLWICMFPSLIALCAALTAALLPLAVWIGNKAGKTLPFGLWITPLLTGIMAHVVLIGTYMTLLNEAYRTQFVAMSFFIPYPFIAGALTGLIYLRILAFGRSRTTTR